MQNEIDFSQKPRRIVPYNFGDPITRDNFIHFFVLSYALSKGSFVIQKVFFIMMEKKVAFPYEAVIENLNKNGLFDAFTEEEQDIFTKSFRGVKKHLEKYVEIEIDDEIRDGVEELYARQKSDGELPFKAALNFFEFEKINSVPEFMITASEFNKRWEDSLN